MLSARLFLSAVIACVIVDTAAAVPFNLGLRRDLPTGQDPSGVAVADFNQDGNLDLAVCERGVDSLAVRFGNGTGKFGPPVLYPTGDSPTAIAAGFINGDGRIDLAVTNGAANTVTIYYGRPLGEFGGRVDYPVGLTPSGIAIGDATADGRPDVVTANAGSNTLTILVGPADTTLTMKTGTGPRSVVIGDVNSDGVPDLVSANTAADSISLIKGLPAGGFAPRVDAPAQDQPTGLALGDLNEDGRPDLVVGFAGSSTVGIYPNTNGTFPGFNLELSENAADAVAIADVTGDGIPDVIIGHATGSLITFLPGFGTGAFNSRQSVSAGGAGILGIAVADVDGDGLRDVVVPTLAPALVSVLCNNGLGTWGPPAGLITGGASPGQIVAADLNGDGHLDLAVANTASSFPEDPISTYLNAGDGTFAPRVPAPGPFRANDLVAADVNGDSKPDLVVDTYVPTGIDTNRVTVLLNQGGGAWARTDYDLTLGVQRTGLAVGDVTHDGKVDILEGHNATTVTQILAGNGAGAFSTGATLTTDSSPVSIVLADADGNGSLDALVGNSDNTSMGTLSTFKADGAGGFLPKVDLTIGVYPIGMAPANLNGDGNLDLAVATLTSSSVAILPGTGGGAFTTGPILNSPGSQVFAVAVADVNGDGDLDVLAGRTPGLGLFYGRGDGSFSPMTFIQVGQHHAGIATGQFDGNGTVDVAASDYGSNSISVLLGRTKTRTALAVSPNPSAVGQNVTFTATVTKAAPDSGNPSGNVRFFDGGRQVGSAPLAGGVATLNLVGNLPPWDRQLWAEYVGDTRFFPSISPTVPHLSYVPSVGVPTPEPAALALAPLHNPVRVGETLRLRVALPAANRARIELLDVRGRVLAARDVDFASEVVELAPSRPLAPGVYLVRLEQGARVVTAREVVL